MLNKKIVGIDLGGTKIHGALIDGNKIVTEQKIKTPQSDKQSDILNALIELINTVKVDDIDGIGIGAPGVVDIENGILRNMQNIPAMNNLRLKDVLEQEFNVPVYLNNDANCFIVGEKYFGSAGDFDDIVGLTLGTGFGGGIIVNGKLYTGKNCGAGEFCSIKYKNHDLEHYCSSQFFEKEYHVSAIDLYNLAMEGDEKALEIFSEFGKNIGEAIYLITLAFDPELIVLGGSISKASRFFEKSIYEVLNTFPNKFIVEKLKIKTSNTPNSAVFGAAALCYNSSEL